MINPQNIVANFWTCDGGTLLILIDHLLGISFHKGSRPAGIRLIKTKKPSDN